MKKYLQKKLNNEKGMTLIELLAVIVIIAIIAAIAIPAIGNIIENSRYSAIKSDGTNVINAANIYFTENPNSSTGVVGIETLVTDGYLQSEGKFEGKTDAQVYVTKGNPHKLTAPAIIFSGTKTLAFDAAPLDMITKDTTKGSAVNSAAVISAAGTSNPE